jgi:hypothetical protein
LTESCPKTATYRGRVFGIWQPDAVGGRFFKLKIELVRTAGAIGAGIRRQRCRRVRHETFLPGGRHSMDAVYQNASRKAAWRLMPFLILCMLVAFLDRVNVGFAALTMNKELGLTAEMFGFGVGIFFFGYFIFEVPSNLILERVGARRWIARIMISWGVISAGFAFVPTISAPLQNAELLFFDNARTFYLMRFIFGAAEAGFAPGITLWRRRLA